MECLKIQTLLKTRRICSTHLGRSKPLCKVQYDFFFAGVCKSVMHWGQQVEEHLSWCLGSSGTLKLILHLLRFYQYVDSSLVNICFKSFCPTCCKLYYMHINDKVYKICKVFQIQKISLFTKEWRTFFEQL